jgi:hypothetical protein
LTPLTSSDAHRISKDLLVEAVAARARPLGLQIAKRLASASTDLELAAGLLALREVEEGNGTRVAEPKAETGTGQPGLGVIEGGPHERPDDLGSGVSSSEGVSAAGSGAGDASASPQGLSEKEVLEGLVLEVFRHFGGGRQIRIGELFERLRRRGYAEGTGSLARLLDRMVTAGTIGSPGPGVYYLLKAAP